MFSFPEFWFTQIIELLHVPLQSLYTYKQRLEECKRQMQQQQQQNQEQLTNQNDKVLNNKIIENGHSNNKPPLTEAN